MIMMVMMVMMMRTTRRRRRIVGMEEMVVYNQCIIYDEIQMQVTDDV